MSLWLLTLLILGQPGTAPERQYEFFTSHEACDVAAKLVWDPDRVWYKCEDLEAILSVKTQ